MKKLIEIEEKVGFTRAQHEALEDALAVTGMRASQWVRLAAAEKLITQGLTLAHGHNHVHDSEEFHSSVQHYFNSLKPPAVEKNEPKKLNHDEDWDERTDNRNVSATPSREVPSASYPDRPGRITLSAEQLDMARRLNQEPVEYARGLLAMRERDKEFGR
jgi:hypothetical protein